ncbi:MAG: V-type ATP synthase subunit B [Polyangiaceae bacterium]
MKPLRELQTVRYVSGPLLFLDRADHFRSGEEVEVVDPTGTHRRGEVLEVAGSHAVIEVFAGTAGLDLDTTFVRPSGELARAAVGRDLLGRMLDGTGTPRDGGPPLLPDELRDVNGAPLNPVARNHPAELIQTGISAIDGLNCLVRGQKLPIFSGFGLPAAELAALIATEAKVPGAESDAFAVVFAAMGITHREASYFRERLAESGALPRTVMYSSLADDPAIERLLTPRVALTAAEYLAFELGMHVLVLMTDMTNYCEALREVATAREEVPGRRGFPGYMYSDLASIYERSGRVRGRPGSLTQLLVVSMPDDDITHPIPDLTGYITEGQIVLSRALHRQGIAPPIDVLPSLSRLMNAGIKKGGSRPDHRALADQLYASYARGRELRRLVAVVGEAALSDEDRKSLRFADTFEAHYIGQAGKTRSVTETLDLGWTLLQVFDDAELKRLSPEALAEARKTGLRT